MTLPDLPLMTLPTDRLRQINVRMPEATGDRGYTGLKIDIVPQVATPDGGAGEEDAVRPPVQHAIVTWQLLKSADAGDAGESAVAASASSTTLDPDESSFPQLLARKFTTRAGRASGEHRSAPRPSHPICVPYRSGVFHSGTCPTSKAAATETGRVCT